MIRIFRFVSILALMAVPFLIPMAQGQGNGGIDIDPPTSDAEELVGENDNSPEIDITGAFETIIRAVGAIALGAFGAAPVTEVIVSALKRISALNGISAPTLTFAVSVILWVGAAITTHFGIRVQFDSVLDFITDVAPPLLAFISTMVGASVVHDIADKRNIPFIGYSRT